VAEKRWISTPWTTSSGENDAAALAEADAGRARLLAECLDDHLVAVGEELALRAVGELVRLPHDILMVSPIAQVVMPDGTVLEGHGVIPDIEVALDRARLLQGVDTQLQAAIRSLTKQTTDQTREP
jgi:hypothetical protein